MDRRHQEQFIESAILTYPNPQVVLAEQKDKRSHFFVIDGKQRLLALRQFYAGQSEATDEGFLPLLMDLTSCPLIRSRSLRELALGSGASVRASPWTEASSAYLEDRRRWGGFRDRHALH